MRKIPQQQKHYDDIYILFDSEPIKKILLKNIFIHKS
jgi:hypothetical protein